MKGQVWQLWGRLYRHGEYEGTKALQHKHLDQLLLITPAERAQLWCPLRGDQVLQTYKKNKESQTELPKRHEKRVQNHLAIHSSRRKKHLSLSVYCSSDGLCIRCEQVDILLSLVAELPETKQPPIHAGG